MVHTISSPKKPTVDSSTAEWFLFFYRVHMLDHEQQWPLEGRKVHFVGLLEQSGISMWAFCPLEDGKIRVFFGRFNSKPNFKWGHFKTFDCTVDEARSVYRLYKNDAAWCGDLIASKNPLFT